MSTPDQRPNALATTRRKPPAFRNADGELVKPKPGETVSLGGKPSQVDIVIAFDTTGSMKDKIEGLKRCMVGFVSDLASLKLDWRLSMLPFGDLTVGDRVVGDWPFVTSEAEAVAQVQQMPPFSGGGNTGESSLEAMNAAMLKSFRTGAVKVIVLLTDEPPLEHHLILDIIRRALRQGQFICFAVTMAGQGYEPLAEDNGGKWYQISSQMDTSGLLAFMKGLLNEIAEVSKAVHQLGGGSVPKYIAEKRRLELEGLEGK